MMLDDMIREQQQRNGRKIDVMASVTKIVIGLCLLAVVLALATGCGGAGNADDINRICKPHGGALSSDYHGGVVICADRIARDVT